MSTQPHEIPPMPMAPVVQPPAEAKVVIDLDTVDIKDEPLAYLIDADALKARTDADASAFRINVNEKDAAFEHAREAARLERGRSATTIRGDLLLDAKRTTESDRNLQYGEPTENFEDIAKMWAVIFGLPVMPEQVALALAAMKICRLKYDPTNRDSWVDAAAYAAIGHEVTETARGGF